MQLYSWPSRKYIQIINDFLILLIYLFSYFVKIVYLLFNLSDCVTICKEKLKQIKLISNIRYE